MLIVALQDDVDNLYAIWDTVTDRFLGVNLGKYEAVMYKLSKIIEERGENHDYTKKSQEKMFYDNFLSTINNGTDFVNDEWYQLHIKAERHHLLSNCPGDVNLIDVLEMISDCVCAGMARSGEVRDLEIDDNILKKAVNNTVQMIKDMIIVK